MDINISGIAVNAFELISLGCIIGFLSGFFGIGGGPLLTPILNIFFGIPFPICIGSNLSRTAGTSFSAMLRYWRFGEVDFKLALMIIGGNFVGIHIGIRLLDLLGEVSNVNIGGNSVPATQFYLKWLFLAVLIAIAILIIIESLRNSSDGDDPSTSGLVQTSLNPTLCFFSYQPRPANFALCGGLLFPRYWYTDRFARNWRRCDFCSTPHLRLWCQNTYSDWDLSIYCFYVRFLWNGGTRITGKCRSATGLFADDRLDDLRSVGSDGHPKDRGKFDPLLFCVCRVNCRRDYLL